MARKETEKSYFTPNEVADLFMVSPITVREWAKNGQLQAKLTPGGHRRFLREEIHRFAKKRGLTLADATDPTTRILVVDDDHQFCSYISELLTTTTNFVTLQTAYDGFSAGQILTTFHPHIVLLDIMMPGMDGFEVCGKIKQDPETERIRVIAMTGNISASNRTRILTAGAECCLAKPIDTDELFTALKIDELRIKA